MTESNAKNERKEEPQINSSQEQCDMLNRCSGKGDTTEWNDWRNGNPRVEINLERAQFSGINLQGADLRRANLQGANLHKANLKGAELGQANLQGAVLGKADLQDVRLTGADLQGVNLFEADLQGADLWRANLQGADLIYSNLQGAHLRLANLQGANLRRAKLQGTDLSWADLKGTDFNMAAVDGETIIDTRKTDKKTDFTGVGLDNARVEPGVKQLLKYNIRRLGWMKWYKKHPFGRWLVQMFWEISDYGRSTGRIIACFFALAVVFAGVYYVWGLIDHPGIVDSLFEDQQGPIHPGYVGLRALYFSVVTMTTLGFGDMHAIARGVWGHVLLMMQVLLGYVLLAALVTRFAVLFTGAGPGAHFPGGKTTWQRVNETLLAVKARLHAEKGGLFAPWKALHGWLKSRHERHKGP